MMDFYLRRLENIMKVYNLDGGILHESLKQAIINNDIDDCSIESDVGIDDDLRYALNMLMEDIKVDCSIPF
jgi:hypothetical protein